jgi:hypothetical protein
VLYSGIIQRIHDEKDKIESNAVKVSGSFSTFEGLFGNLKEIK